MKKYIDNIYLFVLLILINLNTLLTTNYQNGLDSNFKNYEHTEKLYLLDSLNLHYLYQNEDKSIHYSNLILDILRKNDDIILKINALNRLGIAYEIKGYYKISLALYEKSLKIAEDIHNQNEIMNAKLNIGISYRYLGKFDKALVNFLESYEYHIKSDSMKANIILNNIALIYLDIGEYEKSISYLKQSMNYKIRKNQIDKIGANYLNLGAAFYHNNQLDSSLKYQNKAFDFYNNLNSSKELAKAYNNFSLYYLNKGSLDSAIQYAKNSLELKYQLKDTTEDLIITQLNLSNLYFEIKNYQQALINLKQAMKLANQKNYKKPKGKAHWQYYEYFKQRKEFKYALEHYENYSEIVNEMDIEKTRRKINEMMLISDLEKKENQTLVLLKKNETQLFYIIFSVALILFVLILAIVYYKQSKKRMLLNRQLEEKNKEIVQQSIKLKEVFATKDKLFSLLAHDLKNPFWAILEMSKMLVNSENLNGEKIKSANQVILNSSQKLFDLLENILKWSQTQTSRIKNVPQTINLVSLIEYLVDIFNPSLLKKNIIIEIQVEDKFDVYCDKNILITILSNLINNAIKFSYNNSKIILFVKEEEGQLIIGVEDFGIGLEEDKINDIFNIENKVKIKGTSGEEGTGLGLIVSKEFANLLGGNLSVDSKNNKGSIFMLILPRLVLI